MGEGAGITLIHPSVPAPNQCRASTTGLAWRRASRLALCVPASQPIQGDIVVLVGRLNLATAPLKRPYAPAELQSQIVARLLAWQV